MCGPPPTALQEDGVPALAAVLLGWGRRAGQGPPLRRGAGRGRGGLAGLAAAPGPRRPYPLPAAARQAPGHAQKMHGHRSG